MACGGSIPRRSQPSKPSKTYRILLGRWGKGHPAAIGIRIHAESEFGRSPIQSGFAYSTLDQKVADYPRCC